MMVKCVLSGILVLLTASGAWAAIGQAQCFEIGATTALGGGGIGSAQSVQLAVVGQAQKTGGSHYHSSPGVQKEAGVYFRMASLQGPDSTHIGQRAKIDGSQMQVGGCSSPRLQGQHLGADFTTRITMPAGPGTARGTQGFLGGQMQTLGSGRGSGTQGQLLIAGQHASVVGGAQGGPTVTNSLHVDMSQGQVDTSRHLPRWHR